MGRLINADKLIECMNSRYNEKKDIVPDNLAEGFMQMEKLIKEQPIAYDVEKVINKLNEFAFNADMNIGESTMMNHNLIVYEIALDIVREGGNNDD